MRRTGDVPLHYNAIDILERNLDERATKVALYSPDREMTFAQVSHEVNQLGNALLDEAGIRLGDFVALLCPDSAEWATSFFGIIKSGAVAVSLSTALTPAEYRYILNDCRARVLIVHESLQDLANGVRDHAPLLERVIVVGTPASGTDIAYRALIDGRPGELSSAHSHRDDICMLNYSSGSTGQPKGIPHAHKDLPLSSQLYAVDTMGMREDDRTASVARLFFTYGTCGNLIYPWYAGASTVLSPAPPRVASNVLETIDRFKPTILNGVPTGYASMMAVDGFPDKYDLRSLRMCLSAGEALPAPIWQEWKERTGLEIIEGIGTTENLALFLTNRLEDNRPGSNGKPVAGFEIKIADDDGLRVPTGETGNLMVKGETAALSYWHQYDKSRESFRGEWLFTGDLYREDEDGYFWYVGRSDDMLKVGGIWVSPIEVEGTLTSHPAVFECAVAAWRDRSDLVKPMAFVVLNDGYQPSDELAEELISYCASEMAPYKRPRWIEFMDELPRTGTDKIQRSELAKAAEVAEAGTGTTAWARREETGTVR